MPCHVIFYAAKMNRDAATSPHTLPYYLRDELDAMSYVELVMMPRYTRHIVCYAPLRDMSDDMMI